MAEYENVKPDRFEKRLLLLDGYHNICRFYITYDYIGQGKLLEECIELEDMRYSNEHIEFDCNNEDYQQITEEDDDSYYAGYVKKLKNNSIVLTFGKNAKEEIDKF